jgi:hypothetical protein
MRRVWKYELEGYSAGQKVVMMPMHAQPLAVGFQGNEAEGFALYVWALVFPEHQQTPTKFWVVATGAEVSRDAFGHIGTATLPSTGEVVHVFASL